MATTTSRLAQIDERLMDFDQRSAAVDGRLTLIEDQISEIGARTEVLRTQGEAHDLRFQSLTTSADGHSQQLAMIVTQNRNVETRLDGFETQFGDQFGALNGQITQLTGQMAAMMNLLQNAPQPVPLPPILGVPPAPPARNNNPGILPLPRVGMLEDVNPPARGRVQEHRDVEREDGPPPRGNHYSLPRLEFPFFSGENPRDWIRRCEKLFRVYGVPEGEKVELASVFLERKADVWFKGWSVEHEDWLWGEFVAELVRRFEDVSMGGVVGEFNKLRQRGSLLDYQEKFDDLRSQMIAYNPAFTEDYFISSFISGLEDELRPVVTMLRPQSLSQAYLMAKLEEASNEARRRKWRSLSRPFPTPQSSNKSVASPSSRPAKASPSGATSKGSMGTRGACYKCGERYFYGHVCDTAKKHLNALQATDEELVIPESSSDEDDGVDAGLVEEEPEEVAMQALSSGKMTSSLVVQGRARKCRLLILVDTGSTHTFLNQAKVAELQCLVEAAPPLRVKLADGTVLMSHSVCKGFQWEMQGHKFSFDARVLNLGTHDMVLGLDWLRTISPVKFDFVQLQLFFQKNGQEVVLTGEQEVGTYKLLSGKEMKKLWKHMGQEWTAYLCSMVEVKAPGEIPSFLLPVVDEYSDVFGKPKSLPPSRACDHSIPLQPNSQPVNLRPYRYPLPQKDVVEKMTNEMMAAQLIQPSKSPFASPVLLVAKKDGTSRFCVDYRQLNSITIKDKFPIPVIEDFLDELRGSKYFTKLDLLSGYHQIRMNHADQYKTAFRTHNGHFEFLFMPFGLTNAPATFQALMNSIFSAHLRKFILVFFDDILVYSPDETSHITHLRTTLSILRQHNLYAKPSKCSFGQTQVEYLGHIITSEGVSTNPAKISAMVSWPRPKNVKELRGFLGLTGYYRKFVKDYGAISRPLTDLLKKEGFVWNSGAEAAFEKLKAAMTHVPVLALPDFTKPFTLETDASDTGIGAVLTQEGRPIAYLSQALGIRQQGMSAYEKEYLAVLMAVTKWRHYLEGRRFTILNDHESLKHLLGQKIHTQIQKKGLVKLLGLDYEIRYRQGRYNKVADALSRHPDLFSSSCHAVTAVLPAWLGEVEASYKDDEWLKEAMVEAAVPTVGPKVNTVRQGVLHHKSAIYVGKAGSMREQVLQLFHESPIGGHSGTQATYQRLKTYFWWPGLKRDVRQFIADCDVCQKCKSENVPYPGILQPLPIPEGAWKHISMDFIEGLPKSGGKEVILVVVDRFTKYGHFFGLSRPYTAASVAQVFLEGVFKLHGMPQSIVSDRDVIFTSNFWTNLFALQGTQLHYSTAYHPQTDGQTERLNRCLEDYLRCMALTGSATWVSWLPLAEWWYNTNYHHSLQITPFQALYGYSPSHFGIQNPLSTSVAAVADKLREHQRLVGLLRHNLAKAQNRQKQMADKHRTERVFQKGDWVYLKLRPYRQTSVQQRANQKLAPKFYGPFLVFQKIGVVAYKLQLPEGAAIHNVFHVSQLKKARGAQVLVQPTLPEVDDAGTLKLEPTAVLARRVVERDNRTATQLLIQWSHQQEEDATWEFLDELKLKFLDFAT
ncbi:unnamed protein product [Linum trigynum]|uniref:Reverse transcriptase n=1 Tax=Linum trigynum TaxID=586398 RepID=A0AAV2GRL9_9ROSI